MGRRPPRAHTVFPTHPKFTLTEFVRGRGVGEMDLGDYARIKKAQSVDELPHMKINGEDFVMIKEDPSKARLSEYYRKQVKSQRPRAKCVVLKTRNGKRGLYVRKTDLRD